MRSYALSPVRRLPFAAGIALGLLGALVVPDGPGAAQVRGKGVGAIFFGGGGSGGSVSAPALGGSNSGTPSPASLGRSIGDPFGRNHVPGAFGETRSIGNRFAPGHVPGAFGGTGVLGSRSGKRTGRSASFRTGRGHGGLHTVPHDAAVLGRPALTAAAAVAARRREARRHEAAERAEAAARGALRALEALEARATAVLSGSRSGRAPSSPSERSPGVRPASAAAGAVGRALRGEAPAVPGEAAPEGRRRGGRERDPPEAGRLDDPTDRSAAGEARRCARVRIRSPAGIGMQKRVWVRGAGGDVPFEEFADRLRSRLRSGAPLRFEGPEGRLVVPSDLVQGLSVGPCAPGWKGEAGKSEEGAGGVR